MAPRPKLAVWKFTSCDGCQLSLLDCEDELAGCGALCPAYDRGCYGCYGPAESPNTGSLSRAWTALGADERELVRAFRGFNAFAEPFRRESERHDD